MRFFPFPRCGFCDRILVMSKPNKNRIPVDGSASAGIVFNNAFDALKGENLPQMAPEETVGRGGNAKPSKTQEHGRVFLNIEKSGRSGKTVTIIGGPGIEKMGSEQREELLASLKRKFACGGCVNEDKKIELQGDDRERVKFFLEMLGFRA